MDLLDPLKLYDRYRNRPRIRVRILDIGVTPEHAWLEFEVENLATIPNSIGPTITLSGLTPVEKNWRRFTFRVKSQDRSLPPMAPKRMIATTTRPPAILGALWFMTYVFTPTKGRRCRVRLRHGGSNLDRVHLNWLRFCYERLLFRFFRRIYVTPNEPHSV